MEEFIPSVDHLLVLRCPDLHLPLAVRLTAVHRQIGKIFAHHVALVGHTVHAQEDFLPCRDPRRHLFVAEPHQVLQQGRHLAGFGRWQRFIRTRALDQHGLAVVTGGHRPYHLGIPICSSRRATGPG